MSQENESGKRQFTCGAALDQFRRVVLSSGVLQYAGANDVSIGTLLEASFAANDVRSVKLRNFPGTRKMVAAGAIAAGADVWGAASGKVNDVPSNDYIGKTMHAVTGDGSTVEVLPLPAPGGAIEHNTASATLTRAQRNSTQTNLGAAGAVTLTLPPDALAGDRFQFTVMTAQELRVDPGAAGAIYISGAKQADDKYISFDDEGETVTLTADGNGDWIAGPTNGTITVES